MLLFWAAAAGMLQGGSEPKILSLPAKRDGLFATAASLIARSDSNGEDLEGFAGAGELPFSNKSSCMAVSLPILTIDMAYEWEKG